MAITSGEGVGAAGRAVGQAASRAAAPVGRAAGRAVASALPEVDPETLQLAREAHAMGFRLRPDQVLGNKYGKMAGEMSSQVPMSGATTEHNQAVFNRNLVSLIGGGGDKLTRKVYSEAMKESGSTIGDIAAKTPLPIDQSFIGKLRANGANQLPEVASVVNGFVDQIDKMAGKPKTLSGGGRTAEPRVLPGQAFRRINSAISKRMRETSNGDLKSALSNLQDDLLEERSQYLDSRDRVAYDQARRFYAIGKTIEPLVAKSTTGDISPAALLGVVTATKSGKSMMANNAAGSLGKLADIGQRFLKEPASSGTAERRLVQTLLAGAAGGGALLNAPATLGGIGAAYGAANLYNRLGPSVTDLMIRPKPGA